MKRIFALLLALVMCLSLAACGGKDDGKTPSNSDTPPSSSQQQEQQPSSTPDTDEPDNTSDIPVESSEPADDGEEDWTDFFSLPGLATPEGFTVTYQKWGGADEPRICNVGFEKSGGFTEEEINAFVRAEHLNLSLSSSRKN